MVHMPSLEIWEWGLKIFRGAPTLTTIWTICYSHEHYSYVHTHIYIGDIIIMHTKKVNECAVTSERSVL